MTNVLDASAVLAFLQQEPGSESLVELLDQAKPDIAISSVNFCEIITKLLRDGGTAEVIAVALAPFRPHVLSFNVAHADTAAHLYLSTRSLGLSLGDRACITLAQSLNATVWTTDRAWKKLKNVKLHLMR